MVNAWCVLLIFSKYKAFYVQLCGNCERLIGRRCLQCWSCACCCGITKPTLSIKMAVSISVDKTPKDKECKSSETVDDVIVTVDI
eukprot:UN05850